MSTMAHRASTFLIRWGIQTIWPDNRRMGVQVRNTDGAIGRSASVSITHDSLTELLTLTEDVRAVLSISPWNLDSQEPTADAANWSRNFHLTGFKEHPLPTNRRDRILAWGDYLTHVHRKGTTGKNAQVNGALMDHGLIIASAPDTGRRWELTPLGRDLMAATRIRRGMHANPDHGDDPI